MEQHDHRPTMNRSTMAAQRQLVNYLKLHASFPHAALTRTYATQSSLGSDTDAPRRKSISVVSDDGRVAWSDLSAREKASRTTQQSFNFLIIVAGVVMTGAVGTFLYLDVFSSSSKTSHFNRALTRVLSEPRCLELLGDRKSVRAHGEPTWNRWTRNRHIASRIEKDGRGTEHFYMQFYVEGNRNRGNEGIVRVHMSKRLDENESRWELLALDVPGHERVVLEENKASLLKKETGKMFGVRWW